MAPAFPLYEAKALARVLRPEMQKFFEGEEGRRKFREWKERREKNDSRRHPHILRNCPQWDIHCTHRIQAPRSGAGRWSVILMCRRF